jgi:hypothetical protein
MICTALRAVMIYQACGLDKKIPKALAFGIFWLVLTEKMPRFTQSKQSMDFMPNQ